MTSITGKENLKLTENVIIRGLFEMEFLKGKADSCLIMANFTWGNSKQERRTVKGFSKYQLKRRTQSLLISSSLRSTLAISKTICITGLGDIITLMAPTMRETGKMERNKGKDSFIMRSQSRGSLRSLRVFLKMMRW